MGCYMYTFYIYLWFGYVWSVRVEGEIIVVWVFAICLSV